MPAHHFTPAALQMQNRLPYNGLFCDDGAVIGGNMIVAILLYVACWRNSDVQITGEGSGPRAGKCSGIYDRLHAGGYSKLREQEKEPSGCTKRRTNGPTIPLA